MDVDKIKVKIIGKVEGTEEQSKIRIKLIKSDEFMDLQNKYKVDGEKYTSIFNNSFKRPLYRSIFIKPFIEYGVDFILTDSKMVELILYDYENYLYLRRKLVDALRDALENVIKIKENFDHEIRVVFNGGDDDA